MALDDLFRGGGGYLARNILNKLVPNGAIPRSGDFIAKTIAELRDRLQLQKDDTYEVLRRLVRSQINAINAAREFDRTGQPLAANRCGTDTSLGPGRRTRYGYDVLVHIREPSQNRTISTRINIRANRQLSIDELHDQLVDYLQNEYGRTGDYRITQDDSLGERINFMVLGIVCN